MTTNLILDYSDLNLREELLLDLKTYLHDYVREQFDERLSIDLTKDEYYNQLTSAIHYLRDNLLIEFKD